MTLFSGFRLILVGTVAAVLVAGFWGTRMLERSLRDRLESGLKGAFGCQVKSSGLSVHWTSRTLVVRDLAMACPMADNGRKGSAPVAPLHFEPLLSVRRIEARFDLLSLLDRVMDLESLSIEGGRVTARKSGDRDNYRGFLSRWISGPRFSPSGAATIRTISIRDTDLSYHLTEPDIGVTLHARKGSLRPNLFMNRFRLEIPEGSLSGEVRGRRSTAPFLRVTASFAHGGVPDLDILTRSGPGFLELEGQLLSFETEPVVSLFVRGTVPVRKVGALLAPEAGFSPKSLSGMVAFKSYLHGQMNRIKARTILSSPSLTIGGVHMTDARMILSWRPGWIEARPVRVTVNGTRIEGQARVDLAEPNPVAHVSLREKGSGGIMGTFGLSASGTIPVPSAPEEWKEFFESLERLARVS